MSVFRRRFLGAPLALLHGVAMGCATTVAPKAPGDGGRDASDEGDGGNEAAQGAASLEAVRLAAMALAGNNRTLYSWTTREQEDELRRDRVLLSRTVRPGLGPGNVMDDLTSLANAHPAAAAAAQLKFGRFAWRAPWATSMGFFEESYGDTLLEIVLRREAQLVVVTKSRRTEPRVLGVVDAEGRTATLDVSKLVGAFYVNKGALSTLICSDTHLPWHCGSYREVYLGTPAQGQVMPPMVERWSMCTPDMAEHLHRDAEMLRRAAEDARPDASSDANWLLRHLERFPEQTDALPLYREMAFLAPRYRPTPERLRALATRLTNLAADLARRPPFVV
jgi:hypothetical protein